MHCVNINDRCSVGVSTIITMRPRRYVGLHLILRIETVDIEPEIGGSASERIWMVTNDTDLLVLLEHIIDHVGQHIVFRGRLDINVEHSGINRTPRTPRR
jgi:hypothetical protein